MHVHLVSSATARRVSLLLPQLTCYSGQAALSQGCMAGLTRVCNDSVGIAYYNACIPSNRSKTWQEALAQR